jgi:hypothetical protein
MRISSIYQWQYLFNLVGYPAWQQRLEQLLSERPAVVLWFTEDEQ